MGTWHAFALILVGEASGALPSGPEGGVLGPDGIEPVLLADLPDIRAELRAEDGMLVLRDRESGEAKDGYTTTRLLRCFPAVKLGTRWAGMSTRSPVFGLRPTRGSRIFVAKLPSPRISTRSPRCKASATVPKIAFTAPSASRRVQDWSRPATISIKSLFVI